MNSDAFYSQYTSVRATPELVGRTEPLAAIERALRETSGGCVVQISGIGGIGKTRLAAEVLRHYGAIGEYLVARQPVDLYHADTHSVQGLMAAIQAVISPDGAEFKAYLAAQIKLDRYLAEPTGQKDRLRDLRAKVETAFLADLNQLSRDRRLILALDTAEKLVYEITEVEIKLGLIQERFSTWSWLRDVFLPGLDNAVVLIAGRPQADRLADDICQIKTKEGARKVAYASLRLVGFSDDEALAYFEAVAASAESRGASGVAERIRVLPEDVRRGLATASGGRPILLALAVDYLVIADRLPANLDHLTPDELEGELVRVLQETGRPADDAIRALAWARKGVDAELLARIMGLQTADATWDLEQAGQLLEQLHDLSFVKIRPRDHRVFLHDEMYDLLERHVLRPRQYPPAAERVYRTVFEYYENRIKQRRKNLAEAYQELSRTGQSEVVLRRITAAAEQLQETLVEDLHYCLRADARQGFDVFYRYAEEAALGENESLDAQLRAELLGFMAERDPTGTQSRVEGLARADVYADGAIRWVKRRIAAEEYAEAEQLAGLARRGRLIPPGDRLAEAELATWESLAQFNGRLKTTESVEEALDGVIESLNPLPRTWRRDVILARAYNNRGYLHRVAGRYGGAIRDYRKALPLWRAVKIPAEQANTLNNLAFVRSEMGDFGAARRQAQDALTLRRASGARPQIALSLSTLAHIALRDSLLVTAQREADQAWRLAIAVDDRRAAGLALIALAEASRRFGAEGPCADDEAKRLLRKAVRSAKEAIAIFSSHREPSRRVEALIELGCAYRDWMKLLRRYPDAKHEYTVEGQAKKGLVALKGAHDLAASAAIVYRQMDALVNEAWLHYYLEVYYRWLMVPRMDRMDEARQAHEDAVRCLNKAEQLLPPTHRIVEGGGIPPLDPEKAIVPCLKQMGKAHSLRGQMAYNEFEDRADPEMLKAAARHYTLSMAYDSMTGGAELGAGRRVGNDEFRDERRARDRIYERLKTLNPKEWQVVYKAVKETETQYHLGRSEMRDFLEYNFGSQEELEAVEY